MRPVFHFLRAACVLAVMIATSTRAWAAPVLGFVETFPGTSTSSWTSAAMNTNPGTGGAGGAGDGYLAVSRTVAAQLGTFSPGPEYVGDWIAANINKVNLRLNDVGVDQGLAIHFCIGNASNFWLYNVIFFPPENAWGLFSVDLTDSANYTHIINLDGKGFQFALRNTDRVHIRHDASPYEQTPDPMIGDFGIDNVELTNSKVDVQPLPPGVGRAVALAAPFPNPARGAVACAFDTFDDGPVRLVIVDAAGRIVRSESLPGATAGRRTWVWDGLDGAGRVAPAGAYRVRVTGAFGGTSRPFIRVN